jgi:hypothetical protein
MVLFLLSYHKGRKESAMENLTFAPESEQYMVRHMNEQYASSLLMYVKVYGELWEATDANMLQLDKPVWSSSDVARRDATYPYPVRPSLARRGEAWALVEMSSQRAILAQGRTNG